MNYRNGLKALGLSLLAALSVMAFTAVGAQANGLFLILKDHTSGELLPTGWENTKIAGEAVNSLEGDLLILKLNMEVFCHEAEITEGFISENGSGLAIILFKNCLAQGVANDGKDTLIGDPCKIDNIEALTKALVILHEGNTALTTAQHPQTKGLPYILFVPDDKELLKFAGILNHTECALPEFAVVKGCVVAKFEHPHSHLEVQRISTIGMLQLFGCKLNYGTHEAHLNAEADVELAGSHEGLLWGAT